MAFTSVANNLVSDDQNGNADIFTYDRLTGVTALVSRGTSGDPANGWSDWPAISRDGRFISFTSAASDLVYGDTNQALDVFIHDRLTGQTRRASVDSLGRQGESPCGWAASLSGDGRWIAFSTSAPFDPEDTNGMADIYVYNRVNLKTLYISNPWSREEGYLGSDFPKLDFAGNRLSLTARKSEPDGSFLQAAFVYQISGERGQTAPRLVRSYQVEDSDLRAVLSSEGKRLGTRWASEIRAGTQTTKVQLEGIDTGMVDIVAMEIRKDNQGTGLTDPPALSRNGEYVAYSMLAEQTSVGLTSQIYLNVPDPEPDPDYSVSGQVTDIAGAPLRNVFIHLGDSRSTRTDPSGFFLLQRCLSRISTAHPPKRRISI